MDLKWNWRMGGLVGNRHREWRGVDGCQVCGGLHMTPASLLNVTADRHVTEKEGL